MNDVVSLYDQIADEYLPTMYTSNSWTGYVDLKEKQSVLRLWKLPNKNSSNEILLDLGMGPGRWSMFFLKLNFKKVYGVDISEQMVKVALKNVKNKNFLPIFADMKDLRLDSNSFDKIFCFRAFKYSSEPEKVLKEVKRVMKSKGSFILEVSNNSLMNVFLKHLSELIIILFNPPLKSRWRYFLRATFYTDKDIDQLLKRVGLKTEKKEALFVLPSIPVPTLNNLITPLFIFLDSFFLKILPKRLFCRSWIFLIKKENE